MRDRPEPGTRTPRQDQGFHVPETSAPKPPSAATAGEIWLDRSPGLGRGRPGSGGVAGPRASGVEGVLRGGEPVGKERLDRVRAAVDQEREFLALRRGEVAQHVRRRVHPPGRTADSEAQPMIVGGAKRGSYRTKSV